MDLHPDAAALLRAFFDRPTDETPRLVLADWLDDTGIPEHASWAAYIRSRCEAARLSGPSAERTALLHAAERHAAGLAVTLTVPAECFARAPTAFLDLLPADHLTIAFDGYVVPTEFVEVIPESVARTCRVVSLSPWGETLYLATADPADDVNAERLEFILNRRITFLRAPADDIDRAIDASYPFHEIESVTEELLLPPDPPVRQMTDLERGQVTAQFVDLVLTEAVRRGASWVEIRPASADAARVWFRVAAEWHGRDTMPRGRLVAVVARLAEMGGIVAREDGTYPGSASLTFVADATAVRFTLVIERTPFGPWVGLELEREPGTLAASP